MSSTASARTPLIAGNWKMYKTVSEADQFIAALLPRVSSVQDVDVAICPPFTLIAAMAQRLGRRICSNCKQPFEVKGADLRIRKKRFVGNHEHVRRDHEAAL